jgi:putative PIN family toxin of toxin-antitoxin system
VIPDRPRTRAVLDCMLFLQGAARPEGLAGACFALLEMELFQLCLSDDIVAEVRDVLSRPEMRRRFRSLTDDLVEAFLGSARSRAFSISAPPVRFIFNRDPKDEPYINLEIAARAEFLVSRDRDILDLAKPDDADGARLRTIAPNIRIVAPGEFLDELRRREAAGSGTTAP